MRGYRENTLLRDQAILTSSGNHRVPVIRDTFWADYVEFAPFVDFGTGWNKNRPTPDPRQIASVGVGLRWASHYQGRFQFIPSSKCIMGID